MNAENVCFLHSRIVQKMILGWQNLQIRAKNKCIFSLKALFVFLQCNCSKMIYIFKMRPPIEINRKNSEMMYTFTLSKFHRHTDFTCFIYKNTNTTIFFFFFLQKIDKKLKRNVIRGTVTQLCTL